MMIVVVALVGILCGLVLNPIITHIATDPKAANPMLAPRYAMLGYPSWLGIVVVALSAIMAVVLYRVYGLTWRGAYWFIVSLVLIVTGTVDWKVRLIDGLILLVALIFSLASASSVGIGFKNALLGTLIGGIVFILFFILARFMFPGEGVPFGLGDVYLAMYIGGAVGLRHLGASLFYGILMAGLVSIGMLAVRQMGRDIPMYLSYGTYLCLGVLLYVALWSPL